MDEDKMYYCPICKYEHYISEPEAIYCANAIIVQLEADKGILSDLWIEYLTGSNLYSDAFGVEIPEELSGELDIGLPLARKICKALGGE